MTREWRRPLGARPLEDGEVEFRVWAPRASEVSIRLGGTLHPLVAVGHGVHEGVLSARGGYDYRVVLDGDKELPDPCSRWQPEGLAGPSRVVDPLLFTWEDGDWQAPGLDDLVLYELHVGTFSAEATFDGVIPHLPRLRALGITAIELMPVASFAGTRNWGYDGVHLHAPHHAYGGPAGLARLVDAAHREGLAIVLDVVYNHLGPGSDALVSFGPYTTRRYRTPWGPALNVDGRSSAPVREWILQSACQWVRDYHVDGLRLDAVPFMRDASATHIVQELAARVRAEVGRRVIVIAEADPSDPRLRSDRLDWGVDAWWADPFHHALHALLTGERGGYYAPYGSVEDLARAFRRTRDPRLVVYGQNHDQVGNRPLGDRLEPGAARLAALCVCFSPFVPLLFMGEEYGERAPFSFFTDHPDDGVAARMARGRRRYLRRLGFREEPLDPRALETFAASCLDPAGPEAKAAVRFHQELIALRRELSDVDVTASCDGTILRVRRGEHELVCNFGPAAAAVPTDGGTLVLDTGGAQLESLTLSLPPFSGAVVR
jgi:maltooligosyltrehalose trehalohydrolase